MSSFVWLWNIRSLKELLARHDPSPLQRFKTLPIKNVFLKLITIIIIINIHTTKETEKKSLPCNSSSLPSSILALINVLVAMNQKRIILKFDSIFLTMKPI